MPALSSARERGKTAACINNMKTFVIAIANYADDFTTYPWPADKGWGSTNNTIWNLLTGYNGSVKVRNSYVQQHGNKKSKTGPVHNGKASGLHYDGHVSMLDMETEFFLSSDNRGKDIFRRHFHIKKVY